MTTGEKIRYYRNLRGMSQETLGELSGIHYATIKKYELGIRNPKPEQLLKISNALGISINVFLNLDISTVSDVLSLLFKMDDEIDMTISLMDEQIPSNTATYILEKGFCKKKPFQCDNVGFIFSPAKLVERIFSNKSCPVPCMSLMLN